MLGCSGLECFWRACLYSVVCFFKCFGLLVDGGLAVFVEVSLFYCS